MLLRWFEAPSERSGMRVVRVQLEYGCYPVWVYGCLATI